MNINVVKEKAVSVVKGLKLYWKYPPKGRYMPFREIASLSFGGLGVQLIIYAVQMMILSVGNTLIGNTIGIPPKELYVIYVISVIAGFPLTALRAKIIDNSHNKKGKFRPYVFTMAVSTVILAIGFTCMPYDKMTIAGKCITVLLYNIGFNFFYMFMYDSYTNLPNVLSPNTYERSDIRSINSVVDSFAPTIMRFVIPLLATVITGQNTIYNMKIYRVVYPPMLLVGMLLSLLIHENTEEKIVQAKTHIIQVKFMDALRSIVKNKYFWIIALAGCTNFIENSCATMLDWLYNYQGACTPMQYSIITAVYGNSSFWAMLFTPILIRLVGKRNLLISSNLMSIVFIFLMHPVITRAPKEAVVWLVLCLMFFNGTVTMLGTLLTLGINGDVRDYQQYITGERIDGMFLAIGLINSIVNMVSGFVLPLIYDYAGLNETVAASLGYTNAYDVLYDENYFKHICGIIIIAATIGAFLNTLPYFFYDLTETKQKAMVTVLKIRALFEDYGNNALSDENLVEAIDIIEKSQEIVDEDIIKPSRYDIKAAKKAKDKDALKEAKKAYNARRTLNEDIEIAKFVVEEINKFETPELQKEIKIAQQIVDSGLNGFTGLDIAEKRKQFKESEKYIRKYYPDGIVPFDASVFDGLFKSEDETEERRKNLIIKMREAKENKEYDLCREYKAEIKETNGELAAIKKEIKDAVNKNSKFNRAAKPYLDAKKLLTQQENYTHYEEIKAKYEESKARAEKERAELEMARKMEVEGSETRSSKLREERKAAKNKK